MLERERFLEILPGRITGLLPEKVVLATTLIIARKPSKSLIDLASFLSISQKYSSLN